MHVLDELTARGFVKQSTDPVALRAALDAGLTFYIGFDPTGDSLHIGHLVQIMAMRRLQQGGQRPIVVTGGGTALVGDPSGKDRMREVLDLAAIARNKAAHKRQFARFLDLDRTIVEDNADWLCGLGYIDFLREIGSHFSVNRMLSAEGTRQRLERNQGLSFIEFNYHLLQSYDYLVLHQRHACTLQVGGDDQWFNLLGGVDLVRRVSGHEVHAITTPLITTADGKKMGKTEKGAVWLDPDQTSPFEFYQYWINVHDQDVGRFLRLYTDLPLARIAELEALEGAAINEAKRVLAWETTALAHGTEQANEAKRATEALFGGGGEASEAPTLVADLPASVVDLLVSAGLAKGKGAARRLIQQGGCRIGEQRVTDVEAQLTEEAVLWAGKKSAVRIVAR